MPSKAEPLSAKELARYEASRELGTELLRSIQEMKAGKVQVVCGRMVEAREETGLSQSRIAALRVLRASRSG